jgi:predicted small lipoprotein YifL
MSKKLIIVLATALALAACGKKPASVSPPQGEAKDTFPRTYPSE